MKYNQKSDQDISAPYCETAEDFALELSGLRYPVKDNEAEFVKKQNIKFK